MAGSTPIYGFPYPQSTDLVADYPTLGQELATDVETVISGLGSGLNLVSATSIANSGGSASVSGGAITFTGVTSISANGVFSSTYANYRIMLTWTGSTDHGVYGRLRSGGTDRTGGNYNSQRLTADGASTSAQKYSSQTAFTFLTYGYTSQNSAQIEMANPFAAGSATSLTSIGAYSINPASLLLESGLYTTADSNDGLTIYGSGGTISGVIRFYGYKN